MSKRLDDLLLTDTFCPEAWSSIGTSTTGKWRLCCYAVPFEQSSKDMSPLEHQNSQVMKDVRKAMLDGDREFLEPICRRCYHNERNGAPSRRTQVLSHYQTGGKDGYYEKLDEVLANATDDHEIQFTFFDRFDIKLIGNKCNLRCISCGPSHSSAWGIENKKLGWKQFYAKPLNDPMAEMDPETTKKFWEDMDTILKHVHILNFTGGEPFMIDSYWDILDRAIELGVSENIEIHLSSNMTYLKHGRKSVLDYFKHFKHINFQCSIDAMYERNDYIRYPSKFGTIVDNIKKLQDNTDNVSFVVSCVISALSVWDTDELYDYVIDELGIRMRYGNILYNPQYQQVQNLPMELRDKVAQNIALLPEPDGIIGMLSAPFGEEQRKGWNRLKDTLAHLDKHRGTDHTKLWPEIASYPKIGE